MVEAEGQSVHFLDDRIHTVGRFPPLPFFFYEQNSLLSRHVLMIAN